MVQVMDGLGELFPPYPLFELPYPLSPSIPPLLLPSSSSCPPTNLSSRTPLYYSPSLLILQNSPPLPFNSHSLRVSSSAIQLPLSILQKYRYPPHPLQLPYPLVPLPSTLQLPSPPTLQPSSSLPYKNPSRSRPLPSSSPPLQLPSSSPPILLFQLSSIPLHLSSHPAPSHPAFLAFRSPFLTSSSPFLPSPPA